MTSANRVESTVDLVPPSRQAVSGYYWIFLSLLAVAEIVSALALAWMNPVQGYDENWYLINSHRFLGETALPYAHHRPPMLPMLMAMLGDYARLIPGLAHIGSTALVFMILRRIVTPGIALGGVMIFMACGDLRWYNVLLLTELPSIFFLLLGTYFFLINRPSLLGVSSGFALMTHWSMATVFPAVLGVYALRRRWPACARFVAGVAAVLISLMVMNTAMLGGPLDPFIDNLRMNTHLNKVANDWWYYLRELPSMPMGLIGGGGLALYWVIRNGRSSGTKQHAELCALLLGIVLARLVLVQVVTVKSVRFLVPLIPVFLILSSVMVSYYARRVSVQRVVLLALLISVFPGKSLYWRVYDLSRDSTHQIAELKAHTALGDQTELIYTDFNDLAVMAQTGHPAIVVTGEGSWHHLLLARPSATRDLIPRGALYFTWNPGNAEVLATGSATGRGVLRLVRWCGDEQAQHVAIP